MVRPAIPEEIVSAKDVGGSVGRKVRTEFVPHNRRQAQQLRLQKEKEEDQREVKKKKCD